MRRHIRSVELENWRGFRGKQAFGLAPLTVVYGGAATGKTSLLSLMAGLWEGTYDREGAGFPNPPYRAYAAEAGADPAQSRAESRCAAEMRTAGPGNDGDAHHLGMEWRRTGSGRAEETVLSRKNLRSVDTGLVLEAVRSPEAGGREAYTYEVRNGEEGAAEAWKREVGRRRAEGRHPGELFRTCVDVELREKREAAGSGRGVEKKWKAAAQAIRRIDTMLDVASRPPCVLGAERVRPERLLHPGAGPNDAHGRGVLHRIEREARAAGRRDGVLMRELKRFGRRAHLWNGLRVKRWGRAPGDPFSLEVRRGTDKADPWLNAADCGTTIADALTVAGAVLAEAAGEEARSRDHEGRKVLLLQHPDAFLDDHQTEALADLLVRVAAGRVGDGAQVIAEGGERLMRKITDAARKAGHGPAAVVHCYAYDLTGRGGLRAENEGTPRAWKNAENKRGGK